MIKVGIIGGGINSAVGAAHMAAMRMTGKFDIVGGCFSSKEWLNADSAKAYEAKEVWSSYEAMLKHGEWQRIIVLSPTPLHFEHVRAALDLCPGTPVLCEKALCTSSENALELEAQSPFLSCVFNYAFYPAVQRLKQLIQCGVLGELTHIHAEMPQAGYLCTSPQPWRLTDSGVYLDLGTHLHHLIWFLTGKHPQRVSATQNRHSSLDVVDYVSAQIAYNSFDAHLWFGKVSAGCSNGLRIRVFGSEGSAEWYQRHPDTITVSAGAQPEAVTHMEVANPRFKLGHPTGYVEALANLYEAWAADVTHPVLAPSVAVEGLKLTDKMRESAGLRREVDCV